MNVASAREAQELAKSKAIEKEEQLCKLSRALAVLASASSVSGERAEFLALVNEEIELYNSMVDKEESKGEEATKKAYRAARLQSDTAEISTANQEDAAVAYDIAAIKLRGENAITNFDRSRYDVKAIMDYTPPVRRRVEVEDKKSNGGFQTTYINVESTGNVSSCKDCTVPAFGNMLSLGISTFCFPGQSSGLVRAGDENIIPDANWKTRSLRVSESGSSAGVAYEAPIKLRIMNDMRMSKS